MAALGEVWQLFPVTETAQGTKNMSTLKTITTQNTLDSLNICGVECKPNWEGSCCFKTNIDYKHEDFINSEHLILQFLFVLCILFILGALWMALWWLRVQGRARGVVRGCTGPLTKPDWPLLVPPADSEGGKYLAYDYTY